MAPIVFDHVSIYVENGLVKNQMTTYEKKLILDFMNICFGTKNINQNDLLINLRIIFTINICYTKTSINIL